MNDLPVKRFHPVLGGGFYGGFVDEVILAIRAATHFLCAGRNGPGPIDPFREGESRGGLRNLIQVRYRRLGVLRIFR